MVFEVFGMKVDLEFIIKNLKEVQNKVKQGFKDIPGGMQEGIFGGGAKGGGGAAVGGVGKMLGKLTLIAGAALAIVEISKKIIRTLASTSPRLKGIFDMFKRATMNFFRPFGDALATFLKPAAIATMKMSIKWLEFTREFPKRIKDAIDAIKSIPGLFISGLKDLLPDFLTGGEENQRYRS